MSKMISMILKAAMLAVISFSHCASISAPGRIDALLTKTYPADKPGAAALVVRDGRILLRKAYGLADLELQVPLAPESVFPCGSVTKMFTAVAVMQLEEEGRLAYLDPVMKHIPDAPTAWAEITIDHLLSHTSGLVDLFKIPAWMAQWKEEILPDSLIGFFRDRPLQFRPGSKAEYCNSNYVLLGRIVERVTGRPLDQFVKERVINRLGLRTTRFSVGHGDIVPRRLRGYQLQPGGGVKNSPYLIQWSQAFGAGTVHSTVDDIWRFVAGLFDGTLLTPASLAKVTTPRTLPDGTRSPYGYGNLFVFVDGLAPIIRISGSTASTQVYALYVPDRSLFVAVFSNISAHGPGVENPYHPSGVVREIALLLAKDRGRRGQMVRRRGPAGSN